MMKEAYFSLICCTFNPDRMIFPRVLRSLAALSFPAEYEIIIIDNNSSVDFSTYEGWNTLISHSNVKVIRETSQGLTHARLRGLAESTGRFLVFVDDDNVIAPDYLTQVQAELERFPLVHAVGPGEIRVSFTGRHPKKYREYLKEVFQEKKVPYTLLTNTQSDKNSTLFGTGMVVSRTVMNEYQRLVHENVFSSIDRKAYSLASSGDSQIAATVISMGGLIAIAPSVKLEHIISERKSNLQYIKQLLYSIGRYGLGAQLEIQEKLTGKRRVIEIPRTGEILVLVSIMLYNSLICRDLALFPIRLFDYIGRVEARYALLEKKIPKWIPTLKSVFGMRKY